MARNGSGTYSIPNTFSANTTAESSPVNANFTDIGSEITNSLPRDGQAGMTGQFKAASGSTSAPGMAFSSDTDTGFYRKSGNTIGVVAGGTEVGTLSTSGLAEADGNLYDKFPSGTAMLFQQTSAPTGWTKSTDYDNHALRLVSGTAGTGGSTAFTSVFAARTIATANLPAHSHGSGTLSAVSNGAHTHTYSRGILNNVTAGSGGFNATDGQTTVATGSDGAHTHTMTGSTASAGSGTAMDFDVQRVDVILATKD